MGSIASPFEFISPGCAQTSHGDPVIYHRSQSVHQAFTKREKAQTAIEALLWYGCACALRKLPHGAPDLRQQTVPLSQIILSPCENVQRQPCPQKYSLPLVTGTKKVENTAVHHHYRHLPAIYPWQSAKDAPREEFQCCT